VIELFRELEFRSLLARLETAQEAPAGRQLDLFAAETPAGTSAPVATTIINEAEALEQLTRRLADASHIALDVETTGTDPNRADLVGISLAVDDQEGFYLPVGHHPAYAGAPQLPLEVVLEALRPSLTRASQAKVGHNVKFDYTVLANHGLRPAPLTFDTMLAEWLTDPASRNLGLKSLAFVRLGLVMTPIEELIGQGSRQRSMAEVSIARVAPYAAADAAVCLRLMPLLEKEIEEKQQQKLLRNLEMPLVEILAEMERAGVALDIHFLEDLSRSLAEHASALEAEIFDLVGHPFNINSTQQLSAALFKDLGLAPPGRARRTASGHYSTAADILEDLRHDHPVVERILQHREITKLKSTYTDALPFQVNPRTGRVHTSYSQTGTVTGRIASSEPNLQNIPIRTELGRQIRRAFVAAPGHVLLSVDYSQIELRIVAHMAEDQAMLQAFRDDQDIHATTAAAVFGTALDAVTPDMRRRAKAVNFGLIYGMSPFGLSKTTDLTLGEAEEFVRVYFQTFPAVRSYLDRTRKQASERGFVETLLGRRRYFPQLVKGSVPVSEVARSRAEREAVNAPIQGTAADIIKLAMLRLPRRLSQDGLEAPMLLQVHDELVFECPEGALSKAASAIQEVMQNAYPLAIPLKTDAKFGPNWAEMKPLRAEGSR
jgi:DNA polymerase-1